MDVDRGISHGIARNKSSSTSAVRLTRTVRLRANSAQSVTPTGCDLPADLKLIDEASQGFGRRDHQDAALVAAE
jgi:hypothetical protein